MNTQTFETYKRTLTELREGKKTVQQQYDISKCYKKAVSSYRNAIRQAIIDYMKENNMEPFYIPITK